MKRITNLKEDIALLYAEFEKNNYRTVVRNEENAKAVVDDVIKYNHYFDLKIIAVNKTHLRGRLEFNKNTNLAAFLEIARGKNSRPN